MAETPAARLLRHARYSAPPHAHLRDGRTLIAAALQMRTTRSVERNIADLLAMAGEAVAQGATFLQSPEMSNILERNRVALFEAIRPEDVYVIL